MDEAEDPIATSLASLDALGDDHLKLATAMTQAYGGAFYGMDLLAYGALNRSKAHLAGFAQLIRARNLVCAGALLRLQLDTAVHLLSAISAADEEGDERVLKLKISEIDKPLTRAATMPMTTTASTPAALRTPRSVARSMSRRRLDERASVGGLPDSSAQLRFGWDAHER